MKLTLLGASGSIGQQTLNVIEKNRKDFTLVSFSVGNRHNCIDKVIKKHPSVKAVFLFSKRKASALAKKYPTVKFYTDNLLDVITSVDTDMVVNALVGFAGLLPSLKTLELNKKLALANKESLVVGGKLINQLLKEGHGELYPIDSEHSALWKCLLRKKRGVEKLVITASGGAFRNLSLEEVKNAKASDALKHPTWKMGNKITIDCATMMNKTFEVVEAYYLFGYDIKDVEIKLHDESHLHSAVKYKNGKYLGEVNKPDMRNPIKFALYEGKISVRLKAFTDFSELKGLHFHNFDIDRYPLVKYASKIVNDDFFTGAIINASNEVAVYAYLENKISYFDVEKVIDYAYNNAKRITEGLVNHDYASLAEVDRITRNLCGTYIRENRL